MLSRSCGRIVMLVVLLGLAACTPRGGGAPDAEKPLHLSFEDAPAPDVFSWEGSAVRDRSEDSEGFWAVIGGLPRPERAMVENPATGDSVAVALFAGGRRGEIRLSKAAADALGLQSAATRVKVTALRTRPVIQSTQGRF